MSKKYILTKKIESAGFSGSLCQQHFGESINKGYLIWDIDSCTHERRHILNDFGFCKLNISKGEDIWDRIDSSIQLSFNPKKTKIYIEIEDDKENENVELKSQVRKYVKSKYKCESVEVEFKKLVRTLTMAASADDLDVSDQLSWRPLLEGYLDENSYDNKQDVLELDEEVNRALDLKKPPLNYLQWDLNKVVTYNIFSHPAQETTFDFDEMGGLVGIFGKNGNGKSNIIKALVWGLYEKILGGGDNHKVINMYTGINKAYVHVYFTAGGAKFRSKRGISITLKKDGTTKAAYTISYDYAVVDDNGNILEWVPEESDRAAKEKPEVKKLIVDAIGTFENFTKVSLQTQGGKDDYLSLSQQPKNDLMREYNNLGPCDLRYEYANKKFNSIKNLQKQLGDPTEIEKNIIEAKEKIVEENSYIDEYNREKEDVDSQVQLHNEEILKLTEQKIKIEVPVNVSVNSLTELINKETKILNQLTEEVSSLDIWLSNNFSKEIPEGLDKLNASELQRQIEQEREIYQAEKKVHDSGNEWLKDKIKQNEEAYHHIEEEIHKQRTDVISLKNDLELAKGKSCPTCGNVTITPDPEREKHIESLIVSIEKSIQDNLAFINQQREIAKTNITIDKALNKLDAVTNNMAASRLRGEQLKMTLEKLSKVEGDMQHNKEVANKTNTVQSLRATIEQKQNLIKKYEEQIKLLLANEEHIKKNEEITIKIQEFQESIKQYKLTTLQLDNKIKQSFSVVKVQEANVENLTEKLSQIRESVRIYNKYSIYLQAVSRDGIPAQIIKKRLPVINYKINNILRNIVAFKMEIFIKSNGDVQEIFYFQEDKSDALPFSMASGSQKFIGAVAIREALHYISCLIKPSFCIIDEGFDTLDQDKISEVGPVLNYLKNKHKNVIIVTHRNEIKDYVDHIIQVTKSNSQLTPEQVQSNPEAGISMMNFT